MDYTHNLVNSYVPYILIKATAVFFLKHSALKPFLSVLNFCKISVNKNPTSAVFDFILETIIHNKSRMLVKT